MHDNQFGFIKGRSTGYEGTKLLTHILGAWEVSGNAIGLFCYLLRRLIGLITVHC